MQIHVNKILFLISFSICTQPYFAYTQKTNNIKYKFNKNDSSYSFTGSFNTKTKTKMTCLLQICFEPENISKLAPTAVVKVIDIGNNWNKLSYTYRKLIYFENTSVWYRKIDIEKKRIEFSLISSKNNLKIMPHIISSSGYYQLSNKGDNITVKYFQQCNLKKSALTKLYIDLVKKEALKFLHRFSEYCSTVCN